MGRNRIFRLVRFQNKRVRESNIIILNLFFTILITPSSLFAVFSFLFNPFSGTPKFTMQPVDLDLPVGSMATISCAFNGYPAPTVVWKRDHETLTSDERRKVMWCGTSSVLELSKLEYDDEGRYSCFISNPLGNDSTTMTLSLHGMIG